MTAVPPNSVNSDSPKLTPSQEKALCGLQAWMKSSQRFARLVGAAGTGKTFTCVEFIKSLEKSFGFAGIEKAVLFCAPTHAAVRVGAKALADRGIAGLDTWTVARLCGLRESTDSRGKQEFFQGPIPDLPRGLRLILIDEASMIGADLMDYISDTVGGRVRVKVLFIGDRAQLPPVGESESAPLTVDECLNFELDEVVRHGGAILDLATATRRLALGRPELECCADSHVLITNSKIRFQRLFREALQSSGGERPCSVQALAYTNREVGRLNAMARRTLYGSDAPKVIEGEMLISTSTVSRGGESGYGALVAPTTTRMKVSSVEIDQVRVKAFEDINGLLTIYRVEAWAFDMAEKLSFSVVHEDDAEEFQQALKVIASRIKALPIGQRTDQWREVFYPFKNWNAPVQSACATTVHRSQGSTISDVFLQMADIDLAKRDPRLLNRLVYTAATRASTRLVIHDPRATNDA